MGYDVSIVRLRGDEQIDIPESEWRAYVANDPELEHCDTIAHDPNYWEWTEHPVHRDSEKGRPWFHYWGGAIYSKNPDEDTLAKMFQIAMQLNAEVMGQDGEFYDEDGALIPPEPEEPVRTLPKAKPWWRFW